MHIAKRSHPAQIKFPNFIKKQIKADRNIVAAPLP